MSIAFSIKQGATFAPLCQYLDDAGQPAPLTDVTLTSQARNNKGFVVTFEFLHVEATVFGRSKPRWRTKGLPVMMWVDTAEEWLLMALILIAALLAITYSLVMCAFYTAKSLVMFDRKYLTESGWGHK